MRTLLAEKRPFGPFYQGPFTTDEQNKAVVEFTIDADSFEVTMREPATKADEAKEIALNIITPRFNDLEMESTRAGDFKVTVDVTDAELGDVVWLENEIDEAEDDGLDIYDVRVDTV